MKSIFLFILTFFVMQFLQAQKITFILSEQSENNNMLSKELEVFVDSSEKMSFEQILHDSSLHFSNANSVGKPKKSTYWVRINLKSNYSQDVTYRIASFWWDYVTGYLMSPDSTVQILQTGLLCKKSDMKGKDFATFQLPAGKEIKLYARLSASGYFMRMDNVNIMLSKYVPALENERYFLFMTALLFGIMIGFAIYNLSISVSIRDGSYIWYFLYVACLAISLIGQIGSRTSYLTQFILPEHPLVGLFLKRMVDPVAFISLILFSRSFLHTRKKHPRWDNFLLCMIFALTVHSILWLIGAFNRANSAYIAIIFYLASVIGVIITAVIAYREGFKAARFFIAGLIVVAIGILISLFTVTSWADLLWFLPDTRFFSFVKSSAVFFFGGIDAFIFSLALADRQKIRLEKLVAERTEELKHSLDTLQQTQKQLIQSEKMASLGELTAGIAHEIQNPLNFVNNFSGLNTELIDEVLEVSSKKERSEDDDALQKELLNDLKENSIKINHHGQRASSIVKGMLEHSRSSTGQKIPTDINALADEYLKLSYHGLKARDPRDSANKDFNVDYKSDFDINLPKIEVVPQDIGRVLLNLINNAFQAVDEKAKKGGVDYKPTVTVSTKSNADQIEIRVSDNGDGIPETIKDKIFQPFFTTKDTGKGTGLGLSLAYDIVKAYGGEIRVETEVGKGSKFTIILPA
ncbi:MAG: 7TM diverse intracellular signaling domain-containing protein [Saprospiraceae bacterium]